MKIAWTKSTMFTGFDVNSDSPSCCEMRFGFWRQLIKRGHEITLFTPAIKASQKIQEQQLDETYEPPNPDIHLDNTFIKHLNFEPAGFPDSSYDVMFVETAANNWIYPCPATNRKQLRRIAEVIASFKGTVVIWQTDPDLPFPYWKMAMADKNWYAKDNPYRTIGNPRLADYPDLEDYGWSTYDEIFSDKKHIVLTFSSRPDIVSEQYSGSRDKYTYFTEKGLIKIYGHRTPYLQDPIENVPWNDDPEFDLIYTGYPRQRESKFDDLFNIVNKKISRCVTGKRWQTNHPYPLNKRVEVLGFIKEFARLPYVINRAKMSLCLATPKSRRFYWTTCRTIEAIYSKAIVLYDGTFLSNDDLLGRKFAISTKLEANDKMLKIASMSSNDRHKVWEEQFESVKDQNWSDYTDKIEKILADNGVQVYDEEEQDQPYQILDCNLWV